MTTLQPRTDLVNQIESMETAAWQPAYELTRTDSKVTLSVDLPGVFPNNLHVACYEGRLCVWGCRNPAHCPKAVEHFTNRLCGDFALDVPIPQWVDVKRVYRSFEEGILTVVLPKRRESRPSAHGPLQPVNRAHR